MAEEKKSLLGKALDALSDKDEKEALAAAQQQLAAAQAAAKKATQEMAALKASGTQASAQLTAANKRAQEAEAQVKKLQEQLEALMRKERMEAARAKWQADQSARVEAAKPAFMAEHTLTKEETLSHLSLKYYGSATKPYWMLIYEANKGVIGDNPNKVHEGMVLNIPVLPESMKKK